MESELLGMGYRSEVDDMWIKRQTMAEMARVVII